MIDLELTELERRAAIARKAIKEHDRSATRDYLLIVMGVLIVVVGALLMWGPR